MSSLTVGMECMRDKFYGGVLLNGRYQTLSPLNHGSFGMVFMAQDLLTNETVAIKCLTKSSTPDDTCLDLAVDDKSEEYALHTRLGKHSNIVNLLNTFETDAHVYLVLEYCSQGDLYEAIRNGQGPLETEHVRQFMLQLVDSVAYIHSKGVYHRDIKPENIFLTQDGIMKLGDFGLATTDKWSYEMTVGSDRYMAPEQFDSAGAGYSPAEADIWAIGICLLNILFSRNPFTTPTESDPLFLDFSRDKQSLFDVFPSMSQDTYEVIVQCMNMDPKRRSLVGAREALQRVLSFTTQDEELDEFCTTEKGCIASANREPLRTPSIQSPQVDDAGAFPWTKALHAGAQRHSRQLSAIPDNESYSEDLFESEEAADWCSATAQTPSLSSMMNSSLGVSMKSLAINPPKRQIRVSPTAGSLPITMAKPMPSLAAVFGNRKDMVSKSWSDMWDEDEEEEERERQMEKLKELNSRTWSHESKTEEKQAKKSEHVFEAHDIRGDIDDDLLADGFFFQAAPIKAPVLDTPRTPSPPSKRSHLDKWAALGERRRGQNVNISGGGKTPEVKARRHFGFGFKSYEAGVWDHHNYHHQQNNNKSPQSQWGKDRVKECPWNKGRDLNWRRNQRLDLGDVEWVGGW